VHQRSWVLEYNRVRDISSFVLGGEARQRTRVQMKAAGGFLKLTVLHFFSEIWSLDNLVGK
jgi:hypothetical protein